MTKVLDYTEFHAKRNLTLLWPTSHRTSSLLKKALQSFLWPTLIAAPWLKGLQRASSQTSRLKKCRSLQRAVERIIKFKETPRCKACYGKASMHTPEGRKHFTELVEKERKEKEERRSLPPTSGRSVPPTPAETVPPTPAAESVAPPAPAPVPETPVRGDAEVSSVACAAVPSATATSTKLAEATGDQPPVFGVPAGVSEKPAPQQKPVFRNQPKGTQSEG